MPYPVTAAPTKPPIRAWEELEGIPNSQVSRFQTIAEISAAIATKMTRTRLKLCTPEMKIAPRCTRAILGFVLLVLDYIECCEMLPLQSYWIGGAFII